MAGPRVVWQGIAKLRPLLVPLARLRPDPDNARTHSDRNIEAIRASLAEFGQDQLVVALKNGRVVIGNGRLEAARRLGWTHLAVIRNTLTGARAIARALADNRTAELAEWDEPSLEAALSALEGSGVELDALGFADRDLAVLLPDRGGPAAADEAPDLRPANCQVRRGDLYQLGGHRLLCGDSTSGEDVGRLMGTEKAAIMHTDPPYLVNYTGIRTDSHQRNAGKDWRSVYQEIPTKDGGRMYGAFIRLGLRHGAERMPIYIWHSATVADQTIYKAAAELDLLIHCQIIWIKPKLLMSRSEWSWRHEPCFMMWKRGHRPKRRGPRMGTRFTTAWPVAFDDGRTGEEVTIERLLDIIKGSSTAWELTYDGKLAQIGNRHPTQKPIELFRRPMRLHTEPGDVCYEPFSGSGSQIIAGEALGRRVFAMEIEPVFVDVAIRRWEEFTGKKAQKLTSQRRRSTAKRKPKRKGKR